MKKLYAAILSACLLLVVWLSSSYAAVGPVDPNLPDDVQALVQQSPAQESQRDAEADEVSRKAAQKKTSTEEKEAKKQSKDPLTNRN